MATYKKKGKKAPKPIKRTSTATQTDIALLNIAIRNKNRQLQVRLERLNLPVVQQLRVENTERISKKTTNDEIVQETRQQILRRRAIYQPNPPNDVECSSLVQHLVNRPAYLSRLPSTYSTFVKPITNNEKANSTLAEITTCEEESRKAIIIDDKSESEQLSENLLDKAALFCKPGPKSFKRKWVLRHQEDMRVPIALTVNQEESSTQSRCNLPTIVERTTDGTVVPVTLDDADVNVEEVSVNLNIQYSGIQNETEVLQTLMRQINVDVPAEMNQTKSDKAGPSSQNNGEGDSQRMPQNIKFNFAGFATTIAASRSAEEHNTYHNASSVKFDDQNEEKATKYIRITAETVHIHNHFYKA